MKSNESSTTVENLTSLLTKCKNGLEEDIKAFVQAPLSREKAEEDQAV